MEIVWMFLAAGVAFGKGRKILPWVLLSFIFSYAAVILVLLLPTKEDKVTQREESAKDLATNYLTKRQFKDVNTVDDLFKQLETPRG